MKAHYCFLILLVGMLSGMRCDERSGLRMTARQRLIVVNDPSQLFDIIGPYLTLPPHSIVAAFDIDKTIGVVDDPRLSPEYFDYNLETVRRLVPLTRFADPFATTMTDLCVLHETAHMIPLDGANSVSQVIGLLQRHGKPVFGLTARSVPLKRDTVRQAGQDLGIKFTRFSVLSDGKIADDIVCLPTHYSSCAAPAAIFNGIGFCGINSKGSMLRTMLDRLELVPRMIIFFDDDLSKIQSVFDVFQDRYVLGIYMQVPIRGSDELQQQLATDGDEIVFNGRTYPKLYIAVQHLIHYGVKRGSAYDLPNLQSPTSPQTPGPFSCGAVSVVERER